jgi:hypothetical protein
MAGEEDTAAVDAFIRNNGVTRCPTACVLPTQATPDAADRVALARHAASHDARLPARRRGLARALLRSHPRP